MFVWNPTSTKKKLDEDEVAEDETQVGGGVRDCVSKSHPRYLLLTVVVPIYGSSVRHSSRLIRVICLK